MILGFLNINMMLWEDSSLSLTINVVKPASKFEDLIWLVLEERTFKISKNRQIFLLHT